MAVTYPCYWMKKDVSGGWYWIYYAGNGEEIARSSESYVAKSDCRHGIDLLRSSASDKIFASPD